MNPDTDRLRHIPLFEGLPDRELEALASITITKRYSRGNTIFSEGESAAGFHVLTYGKVKIFKISPDGKEQILHVFGPGEPFGEVPVFEGRSYPANALALEDCRSLFFPRTDFVHLIERMPSLALNMLAELSRRLRRFTVLIDALSLKEVPGRLAGHLLHLSEQQDGADAVRLDVTKRHLAAMLGTIPETLSRIVARMDQAGFITSDGKTFTLRDRKALTELRDGVRRLS